MAEFSNYAEDLVINVLLRGASHTGAATVYVGLFTDSQNDADGGTEVTGGSYARTAVTFGAPSNGVSTNTADVTFPTATANWGQVQSIGIYDASTGGNLIVFTDLDTFKTIDSGDIFKITTGNLSVTVA
jgi:hypothetical protein